MGGHQLLGRNLSLVKLDYSCNVKEPLDYTDTDLG